MDKTKIPIFMLHGNMGETVRTRCIINATPHQVQISTNLSMSESLIFVVMALGCESPNLKMLSMTDISVLVVSSPQNDVQSLTTIPPPITSLPLFTVPA